MPQQRLLEDNFMSKCQINSVIFSDISFLVMLPAQLESKLESPNKRNHGSITIDSWSI